MVKIPVAEFVSTGKCLPAGRAFGGDEDALEIAQIHSAEAVPAEEADLDPDLLGQIVHAHGLCDRSFALLSDTECAIDGFLELVSGQGRHGASLFL
jgi:hypothetical protein